MVSGRESVLVAGGGGFIGGHLARTLTEQGYQVRSVDIKPLDDWHQIPPGVEPHRLDLSALADCRAAVRGIDTVYNLAADMGGMGFIETHKAECMLSVLINTHLLIAARDANVGRFFFSSSACVYNADKQMDADVTALTESDAYPAMPEDGYGWEKLFSERMCRHFHEDFGLQTRVARYHNAYGVNGTYDGGREKAPAALCRKIARAVLTDRHEIEIWGDGEQTRSFMYVDDCVEGTLMVTAGDSALPVNVGSSELVSINEMADIIEQIAGITVKRIYKLDAPLGVRGRNSDNKVIREIYDWEPSISLADGLERTYRWIFDQLSGSGRVGDHTARHAAV
ncbi:NAD-dependent epimerase/dehydratase family protein [Mycobacterium sp.]|uniref:NAD-dependent epimerase/dehydratase family protein n=1 Tax=Mycobacterium sp. TaxID=1785 RepID=UPI003D6B1F85